MNLFSLSSKPVDSRRIKRVLIINPFGIGDVLFITPLIRSLKNGGIQEIDLLLGSRTGPIFKSHPLVNQIFEWNKSKMKSGALLKFFWRLNRRRYDAMIDVSFGSQYASLSWAVFWIPIRIGFNFKKRGLFLTHKVNMPDGYRDKPVAEAMQDLLSILSIKKTGERLEFFLTDEERGQALLELRKAGFSEKRFVMVSPGGGESWGKDARLKRWPVSHFARLLRLIKEMQSDLVEGVVIVGGENERALADDLQKEIQVQAAGTPVFNACGLFPIRISAAILEQAAFLIANDGGLVHIGSALQVPVVALYGPVDPKVYGPYPGGPLAQAITNDGPECRPCYKRMRYQADCVGVECLNELSPESVLHQLKERNFFEHLRIHS